VTRARRALAVVLLALAGCGADSWTLSTTHGGPSNPNTTLDGAWTWKPDAWDAAAGDAGEE
jgi:hypothetical protein